MTEERVVLVTAGSRGIRDSQAYLRKAGTPRQVSDLQRHRFVLFGPLERQPLRLQGPQGEETVTVQGPLIVHDLSFAADVIASGVGVGLISYSLYLVHPFTYYCTRLLFLKLGWFTDDVAVSMTLFATVVLVSSLLVTHVVHIALERWPYQRIFHQRVYRTKPAGGSDR